MSLVCPYHGPFTGERTPCCLHDCEHRRPRCLECDCSPNGMDGLCGGCRLDAFCERLGPAEPTPPITAEERFAIFHGLDRDEEQPLPAPEEGELWLRVSPAEDKDRELHCLICERQSVEFVVRLRDPRGARVWRGLHAACWALQGGH